MFGRPRKALGLGPADAAVATRVRPGSNFYAYPTESVSLSRDAVPYRDETTRGLPDPLRYGDEYTHGKPFPWPGMSISFTFSPAQWKDSPPMGYIRRPIQTPGIHIPQGQMQRFGDPINIEAPPAHAYGSLFATYEGE